MKELRQFIFLILTSCLFYSCSGNSTASMLNDNGASSPGNSSANSAGDASFSCKVGGKDFSGKGNDSYSNVAKVTSPGLINFVLVPMEKQPGVAPQCHFIVADHGTTIIHASNNGDYVAKYSPGGIDNDYKCKEITVKVSSSGRSKVKGTFSGTLIDPKTDKEIVVTEGKFDIPYSPYSKK